MVWSPALYAADAGIFDLYSMSIGPGFAPSTSQVTGTSAAAPPAAASGTGSGIFGFGFASGTIFASGVSDSTRPIASSSEIFSLSV